MKSRKKKEFNSYIPLLVFILVLLIGLILVFTIVLGKTDESYRNDHLNELDYVLDDNIYYKNVTNNTMDDFYNKKSDSFLEYKYEVDSNTFYETKLDYINNVTSSLIFRYILNDNLIRATYELSTTNSNVIIEGNYNEQNNSISCNIESSNNYNSTNIDSYCNIISNNIEDFKKERDNFINDSKFTSILQKESSEVVIGDE